MVTDCSGLIYWACRELGEKVVHHATYLYTDWCRPKGKLVNIAANAAGETKGRDDGQPIRPGTLVFIKGTQEKIHHTGVYIGDDTVIEAKGTRSGVVTSKLSHWEYWGELKVIDYTNGQQKTEPKPEPKKDVKPDMTLRAKVTNPHIWLNVRQVPDGQLNFKVQKGTIVDVLDSTTNGEWWQISYNGKTGWAKSEFLTIQEDAVPEPVVQQAAPVEDTEWEESEWPEPQNEWPEEVLPFEEPLGSISEGDVLGALKSISADLAIMTRLVRDAEQAPSADKLIEILNAMDIVLPQVQAAQKDMWRLVTVG